MFSSFILRRKKSISIILKCINFKYHMNLHSFTEIILHIYIANQDFNLNTRISE